MNKYLLLIFSLFLVLPVVARQPDCEATNGIVQRETYYSDVLERRMYYSAYVPPCYEQSGLLYPVIYLMHGSNEDDGHWVRLGIADALDRGIADGTMSPAVVVMPYGEWIANQNRFDRYSWKNVFLTELMPEIERQYNIDPRQSRRAIGGISRGGFWAYQIGLSNPELFGTIGGHSAFFDRYHVSEENNPLDLALRAPEAVGNLRLWLDRGVEDYAAPGLQLMHDFLNERGIEHQYHIDVTGQHNNDYWHRSIVRYLEFYTQEWLNFEDWLTISPGQEIDRAHIVRFEVVPVVGGVDQQQDPETTKLQNDLYEASRNYGSIREGQSLPIELPNLGRGELFDQNAYLLVPSVVFTSLKTSIAYDKMQGILSGELDSELMLSSDVADLLRDEGFQLHPATQIVSENELYGRLAREPNLYTFLPFDKLNTNYRILWIDDQPLMDILNQYPLVFDDVEPNFDPELLTRITLSGVTALTRSTLDAIDRRGVEWLVSGISSYVTASDYFHTSNEVSFHPDCPNDSASEIGGTLSFCSKVEHFEAFNLLDLDVVELTGNHNNDYGYDAYEDTYDWYLDNDIATVGGGRTLDEAREPHIYSHNGNSIAHIACNSIGPYYALVNEDPNLLGGERPGAADCDFNWLQETLPKLADQFDFVIVSVQDQELGSPVPSDKQRSDFQFIADLGADFVVGTSSHRPQIMETYLTRDGRQAILHFGMGNLFFDQPFSAHVQFLMDTLYIYDGQLIQLELFPGLIEDYARPRLMTEDERVNFLFYLLVQKGNP